jgi:hypothetical protein
LRLPGECAGRVKNYGFQYSNFCGGFHTRVTNFFIFICNNKEE